MVFRVVLRSSAFCSQYSIDSCVLLYSHSSPMSEVLCTSVASIVRSVPTMSNSPRAVKGEGKVRMSRPSSCGRLLSSCLRIMGETSESTMPTMLREGGRHRCKS